MLPRRKQGRNAEERGEEGGENENTPPARSKGNAVRGQSCGTVHGDRPFGKCLNDVPRIATFRIIQEALNNVVKHSEAHTVEIDLDFEDHHMRVRVRDDGRGFDLDRVKAVQSSSRPSLGLAGMQERAALLGGRVSVQSRPGQGTLVEASIPYHYESENQDDHTPVTGG